MSYPPQGGGWQQDQQGNWQQAQPGGWQDPAGGGYVDPSSGQPAYVDPISGQPAGYQGYGAPAPQYPTSPDYGYQQQAYRLRDTPSGVLVDSGGSIASQPLSSQFQIEGMIRTLLRRGDQAMSERRRGSGHTDGDPAAVRV